MDSSIRAANIWAVRYRWPDCGHGQLDRSGEYLNRQISAARLWSPMARSERRLSGRQISVARCVTDGSIGATIIWLSDIGSQIAGTDGSIEW